MQLPGILSWVEYPWGTLHSWLGLIEEAVLLEEVESLRWEEGRYLIVTFGTSIVTASKIVGRVICEWCCIREIFECFENFVGIRLDPKGCLLTCCVVLIGDKSVTEELAMLG